MAKETALTECYMDQILIEKIPLKRNFRMPKQNDSLSY